jgi:hypothetical protein
LLPQAVSGFFATAARLLLASHLSATAFASSDTAINGLTVEISVASGPLNGSTFFDKNVFNYANGDTVTLYTLP